MSKKKTNSILIIVLLVLLLAVVSNQIIKSKKGERTFKSELTAFTADEVESISIFTKANNYEPMKLTRNGDDWKLNYSGKDYTADPDMTSNIANDLSRLKADRLIANKKDKWSEFDVSDTTGVKVLVEGERGEICEVYIGRFSYNQNSQKASTFVRLADEKDVYSVEGYLGMVFNRDLNSFRNKSIFRGNQNDLTRVSFQYPGDSAFTLSKEENNWLIGDMPADSTITAQYLSGISYLTGSEFKDDFDPANSSYTSYKCTIEGNNMSSLVITGYRDESGNTVVSSSLNPGAYFDGTPGELFNKIFKGVLHFSGVE